MIDKFKGKYFFLSNFYEAPVMYEGLIYLNNEAAFQSAKLEDVSKRISFCSINPSKAKSKGRRVQLRYNWEKIKDEVMYQCVLDKFTRNSELKEKLINTGDEELVEGNDWGDTYWGMVNNKGKNVLGKILMRVRKELKR